MRPNAQHGAPVLPILLPNGANVAPVLPAILVNARYVWGAQRIVDELRDAVLIAVVVLLGFMFSVVFLLAFFVGTAFFIACGALVLYKRGRIAAWVNRKWEALTLARSALRDVWFD